MNINDLELQKSAILLDVDGTLLDIAATPHDVRVPERLKGALSKLRERTNGAVAFISGRPLAELDRLFAPLRIAIVGGHGAEIRINGTDTPTKISVGIGADLRNQFEALTSKLAGVLLEDKGYSIALHYRLAPQHADVLREGVAAACAAYPSASIEVLPGKAMIEVKPAVFSKGSGVRTLMHHAPFAGRRPVFVGDDVTDETVFAMLPEFDGLGYSVGRRIKGLAGCFPRPIEVRTWIYQLAEAAEAVQP
ncbi:MAG: trehalose-phosphatase [Xanthobacteraceae bacterium]